MNDNKHVEMSQVNKLADSVDAADKGSVDKFLNQVSETFKDVAPDERATKIGLLSGKLEEKGILPQLLVTAGLGDTKSDAFQALKENDGYSLKKDTLDNIAGSGKKGFTNLDAAAQFLASSVSRNFDSIDGADYKNGKATSYEVKKWSEQQSQDIEQRKGFEKMLVQFGNSEKLEQFFGTKSPKLEDMKHIMEKDDLVREIGGAKHAKALPEEKREALKFMIDNFETLSSMRCAWGHDDYVDQSKFERYAERYMHTSAGDAERKQAQRQEMAATEAKEVANDKARVEADKKEKEKPSAEAARIKDLEEKIRKLEEMVKPKAAVPGAGGDGKPTVKPGAADVPTPTVPKPNGDGKPTPPATGDSKPTTPATGDLKLKPEVPATPNADVDPAKEAARRQQELERKRQQELDDYFKTPEPPRPAPPKPKAQTGKADVDRVPSFA